MMNVQDREAILRRLRAPEPRRPLTPDEWSSVLNNNGRSMLSSRSKSRIRFMHNRPRHAGINKRHLHSSGKSSSPEPPSFHISGSLDELTTDRRRLELAAPNSMQHGPVKIFLGESKIHEFKHVAEFRGFLSLALDAVEEAKDDPCISISAPTLMKQWRLLADRARNRRIDNFGDDEDVHERGTALLHRLVLRDVSTSVSTLQSYRSPILFVDEERGRGVAAAETRDTKHATIGSLMLADKMDVSGARLSDSSVARRRVSAADSMLSDGPTTSSRRSSGFVDFDGGSSRLNSFCCSAAGGKQSGGGGGDGLPIDGFFDRRDNSDSLFSDGFFNMGALDVNPFVAELDGAMLDYDNDAWLP